MLQPYASIPTNGQKLVDVGVSVGVVVGVVVGVGVIETTDSQSRIAIKSKAPQFCVGVGVGVGHEPLKV
jgi:hypothetical protein